MNTLKNSPRVLVILHDHDGNLNEFSVPLAEEGLLLGTWDVRSDLVHRPQLDELNKYSGIISLGSHNGIQDEPELEWMQYERKIVQFALENEVPFFGLCFGPQMLASAAGGTFKPSPVPELGWTHVDMNKLAENDDVMKVLGASLDAFHYHFDSYDLPDSAVLLGETNGIVEAFRVGKCAWATQFHLEVGLAQQLAWLASYRKYFEKAGINVDEQIELSYRKWREYQEKAHLLATAFAQQVKLYARHHNS